MQTEERFERVAIGRLVPSKLNPRKTFTPATLAELAASIREKGVIEPLVARPCAKGDALEVICGERRLRASREAGLTELPVIVRTYTDSQAIEVMAIENGLRDDVPPLEEAAGYKQLVLIDQTYTPAKIAQKIGHSERYVWDRMRLLDLVPELQDLLSAGTIGVEHAEVLAKLKPADQKRAMNRDRGGLFEFDGALDFDTDRQPGSTAYDKVKPRSVRQLRQWVAEHVRLDVKHAAATAPLEFGDTAQKVEAAAAAPGRGKKVVPITFSHTCPDGAKDADERTYGATAWKRAEGRDGQPSCEHSVLGVVVAGEHYGDAFPVCIARDRCKVHWREAVTAKEKAAKLRESGKGKAAATVERKAAKREESAWERKQAERDARRKAWLIIQPHIEADAVAQVKGVRSLTARQGKIILDSDVELGRSRIKQALGASWYMRLAAALLVSAVTDCAMDTYNDKRSGFDQYIAEVAKPLGLNVKRLEAVRDKHQPKPEPKADAKTAAAKKAKGKKAA